MVAALLIAVLLQQESPLQQAWVAEFDDPILGGPQGAGDLIYVATHGGTVAACKADTGDRAWIVDTKLSVQSHVIVLNKAVFVPANPSAIVLDAGTGKVLKDKIPFASRAIAGQSRIYLLNSLHWNGVHFMLDKSRRVSAYEPARNKVVWDEEIHEGVLSVLESGSRLYLSTPERCIALDPATGRKIAEERATAVHAYHALADSGRIFFFGPGAQSILNLDPKSLKEKWRFGTRGLNHIPPIVLDGRIILFTLPEVIAVDSKTGKEAWKVKVEAETQFSTTPPAVRGNEICVGFKGILYGVDAAAGKATWFMGTGGLDLEVHVAQPAWIGDRLYYAVGRRLFCFKLKT